MDRHHELTKLKGKITKIRLWALAFAILGFISIIGTTLLLRFIEEIDSENLYEALVSYWILVCVSFGVQMLYTLIRLYKTFKKVYKGSIEREDKQILFYLVIFATVYLFMALSNLFRLIDDLFDTNEFSLAAYFL